MLTFVQQHPPRTSVRGVLFLSDYCVRYTTGMEEEIKELRALVKQNLALTQETNHIVRGMRRSARWGRFFSLVWWVAIIAVSGATYYLYLQPYVDTIQKAYGSTKNFEAQIQNVLKSFGGAQSSPPAPRP